MTAFAVTRHGMIAVISFDTPNEPTNRVSRAIGWELEGLLQRLDADEGVQAVVIRSAKRDSFIAGADLDEYVALQSVDEAIRLSRESQLLMQRIAECAKPVVAAIHGACLGAGLELATACAHRVASDSDRTTFGLPEIQLGVIPAAGGCVRIPRVVGASEALDMVLSGQPRTVAQALATGLIDDAVPESLLLEAALAAAMRLAHRSKLRGLLWWKHGGPQRRMSGGNWRGGAWLLDRNPLGRRFAYRTARRFVSHSSGTHYPAPLRAIDVIATGLAHGEGRGFEAEARAFGDLVTGAVSRRLMEIGYATAALRRDADLPPGTGEARPVHLLGIVGATPMGSGLAAAAAWHARVEVRLRDADLVKVGRGLHAAHEVMRRHGPGTRTARRSGDPRRALLSGTATFDGFAGAELIIESVFDDLALKRQVVSEIEAAVPSHTVIGTTTSTQSIHDIAEHARQPERIVGTHFFAPAESTRLVEIVPGDWTSADAVSTVVRFARRLGKTAIIVADAPGFWVDRLLMPYLNEAALLLEEGTPIELIDSIMTQWGFAAGPLALLDELGFDRAERIGNMLYSSLGERLRPSRVLAAMRQDDRAGRSNARGFYFYKHGRRTNVDRRVFRLLGARAPHPPPEQQVEDRLVFAMLNEAAHAMGSGIVSTPRDGDIGALFGLGFPPWRGGPLRELDVIGATEAVLRLEHLSRLHGPRFEPAPALIEMAQTGQTWYPQ